MKAALLALILLLTPTMAFAACTTPGPATVGIGSDWGFPESERPKLLAAILKVLNDLGSKDCELLVAPLSVIPITENEVEGYFLLGIETETGTYSVGEVFLRSRKGESQIYVIRMSMPGYEFTREGLTPTQRF